MWRLGVERILGLELKDGQLTIDPCIPASWKGFEAWLKHGSQNIHVLVENPDGVARGVVTMTLDGALQDSNRVVVDRGLSSTHEVRVRMGVTRRSSEELPRRSLVADGRVHD
jgi:cyclic beta-1,2-glucan synthetase